jgi:hypothetical protein
MCDPWEMPRRSLLATGLVVIVASTVAAGCSGNGEAQGCAIDDGAEVCMVEREGARRVTFSGLQPGSVVQIVIGDEPPMTVDVGPDGREIGTLSLVSMSGRQAERIVVEGTGATGAPVQLTVEWPG